MEDKFVLKGIICPRPLGKEGRWGCTNKVNESESGKTSEKEKESSQAGWMGWVHGQDIKQLTELNQRAYMWHVSSSIYPCLPTPHSQCSFPEWL